MSDYIRTYTGQKFEPADPEPETIIIEDIAHALSMLCRGNGHVKTFWSVGEHCICCAKEARARGLSDRMALICLLHDAAECYLSDVPSPFKKTLPEYQAREDTLMDMIYERFLGAKLTTEEYVQMKAIDRDLLWYDLKLLLGEDPQVAEPKLQTVPDYTVRPFQEVEQEYLELFYELSGARPASGAKKAAGTAENENGAGEPRIPSGERVEAAGTAELRTERLLLRRYRPEDAEALHRELGTDPVMFEFSGWNPYATPEMARETVRRYIDSYSDGHFYGWAMDCEGVLCGTIGAYDYRDDQIEVGFSVIKNCWGRGYATEALKAVLEYLTEQEGIACVTAWCAADNIGSWNVLETAGMQLVRVEKDGLALGDGGPAGADSGPSPESGGVAGEARVYDKRIYEYRVPASE